MIALCESGFCGRKLSLSAQWSVDNGLTLIKWIYQSKPKEIIDYLLAGVLHLLKEGGRVRLVETIKSGVNSMKRL